jgi:hypothetical protein
MAVVNHFERKARCGYDRTAGVRTWPVGASKCPRGRGTSTGSRRHHDVVMRQAPTTVVVCVPIAHLRSVLNRLYERSKLGRRVNVLACSPSSPALYVCLHRSIVFNFPSFHLRTRRGWNRPECRTGTERKKIMAENRAG